MTARTVGALAAALALGVSTALAAQANRWERAVADHLSRVVRAVSSDGSERQEVTRRGVLNTDETESFTVTLRGGITYAIVGVCDDDCTRLQLAVTTLDHDDRALDRSGETLPVLRYTPARTESYRVKVVMEGCRVNPCWYGVAIVPRPR